MARNDEGPPRLNGGTAPDLFGEEPRQNFCWRSYTER